MTDLTSIDDAWQNLYEQLSYDGLPVDALAGLVVRVFKGEPTPGVRPRVSAVTIFWDGKTATEYTFRLRVYVDPTTDALLMQAKQAAAVDAIDGLLEDDDRVRRVEWVNGYDPNIDALVAQTVVTIGREDF